MATTFTFSSPGYVPSTSIRFYSYSGGVDFDFIEDGYTPETGSIDFDFGDIYAVIFRLLPGTSSNFSAVWADNDTSRSKGKMYIATNDAFYVINLNDKSVYDMYTKTFSGRAKEVLLSDDIVDINA